MLGDTAGLRGPLCGQGQRDVDDHVLLPADQLTPAALHEDVADVYSVPFRRGLRMPEEGRIHTRVSEREGLAVDPHGAVLQRADDVVGGVLEREQIAPVLEARQVRD